MRRAVFLGFRPIDSTGLNLLRRVGATTVILGLDDEDDDARGVDPTDYADRWTVRPQLQGGRAAATLRACRDAGMRVGVHVWGRPVRSWTHAQAAEVRAIHAAVPLDRVMIDHERHGLRMDPVRGGYGSHAEWVADVARLWTAPPYVGAYPSWPELWCAIYGLPGVRHAELVRVCAGAVPMVYGDLKHTGLDPLPLYRRSARACAAILRPDQRLVMGVGAYDQSRPGVTAEAMIQRTLGALRGHDVAIWSLPHLLHNPGVVRALEVPPCP